MSPDLSAFLAAHLSQLFVIFAGVAGVVMLATADLLICLALFDVEVVYEPTERA